VQGTGSPNLYYIKVDLKDVKHTKYLARKRTKKSIKYTSHTPGTFSLANLIAIICIRNETNWLLRLFIF
jgi:hypothetical protein